MAVEVKRKKRRKRKRCRVVKKTKLVDGHKKIVKVRKCRPKRKREAAAAADRHDAPAGARRLAARRRHARAAGPARAAARRA